jgi:hypothetical protein
MTTVAGVTENGTQQADTSPAIYRAHEALHAAGEPQAFVLNPDAYDEDMAAYAIALAIRENMHQLPVRERVVLAAALLPEFENASDQRV